MSWANILALLLSLLLAGCFGSNGEQIVLPLATGEAKVGPAEQTMHFALWNTGRAWVNLTVPPPARINTPVDVVLLFDRTASMDKFIRNSAKAASTLVAQVRGLAPDSRIAVATLADYYPSHTPNEPDSIPWQLQQDFTTDAATLERALETIHSTNGGDTPEAYTTALFESARLPWRANARRFIVLLGDSYNHPVDPGQDGVEGTADDLRLVDALNSLRKEGVSVLGIQAGSDPLSSAMFQTLAVQTGGSVSPLDSASDTARLVQASVLSALLPKSEVAPQGGQASWVRSIMADTVDHNGYQKFAVNIDLPAGTAAGLYVLPVRVNLHEGGHSQSAVVNIRLVVGWTNHPLTPFLPLALLLLLAIFILFRALFSRSDSLYAVGGTGPFWEDVPKWATVLLDTLIWLSILLALVGVALLMNKDWIPSEILRHLL